MKSKYASVIQRPTGPGLGNDIRPEDDDLVFDGMTVQQYHEQLACPKRLVPCPNNCLEWVRFEILESHMNLLCVKRPAKPIFCRLGCGISFGGISEKLLEAEEDRHQHEEDICVMRIVRCMWKFGTLVEDNIYEFYLMLTNFPFAKKMMGVNARRR